MLAGVSVFLKSGTRNKHESPKMRRWQTATGYRGVYILACDVQEFCGLTYGSRFLVILSDSSADYSFHVCSFALKVSREKMTVKGPFESGPW